MRSVRSRLWTSLFAVLIATALQVPTAAASPSPIVAPLTGTWPLLVVPVTFADCTTGANGTCAMPSTRVLRDVFAGGKPSATGYWHDVSRGRLTIVPTIVPTFAYPESEAAFCDATAGPGIERLIGALAASLGTSDAKGRPYRAIALVRRHPLRADRCGDR